MAPSLLAELYNRASTSEVPTKAGQSTYVNVIESWGEGFNFGGLIILMLVVVCNIRRHVLLHKLILLEQFLALWHATMIFMDDPVWGWYLSSTVIFLYISYFLHNFIGWMKIRPFLSRRGSWIYLGSLILVEPYWAVALWTNYEHFNGLGDDHYEQVRPYETFAKEPWWVFTTIYLIWVLKKRYNFGFVKLILSSPRFGVLILCMVLSVCLAIIDAVVVGVNLNKSNGINPYWRLSLVFKCAADTIFLDDFKKVLDGLVATALHKATHGGHGHSSQRHGSSAPRDLVSLDKAHPRVNHVLPSPDGANSDSSIRPFASKKNSYRLFRQSADVQGDAKSPARPSAMHDSHERRFFTKRHQPVHAPDGEIVKETTIQLESLSPQREQAPDIGPSSPLTGV